MSGMSNASLGEEPELSLRDYLDILRHRFGILMVPTVIVAVIAAVVAVILPPVYRSSATILVESQQIPTQLVQSMVTSYADERIQVIKQRVMTRENLVGIIKKHGLYAGENLSFGDMINEFRRQVGLKIINTKGGGAAIAFTVSFDHREIVAAQKVTNELVTLFLNENAEARTKRATETTEFLAQEAGKLNKQIQSIEQQIAEYKQQFRDSLPENLSLNIGSLERARADLRQLDRDVKSTQEQKDFYAVELSTLLAAPVQAVGRQGNMVLTPAEQLALLHNELTEKEAELLPTHPDIRGLKARIASFRTQLETSGSREEVEMALDVEQRQLGRLRSQFTEQHPDVREQVAHVDALAARLNGLPVDKPPSVAKPPGYREIEARIKAMDGRLEVFADQRSRLVEKIENLEQRIEKTPQVERGFKSLARDYENATAKYREVRSKEMEAKLGQSLEEDRKAERFSLLEPANKPQRPEKPNRPVILLLGLVLAVGVGGGSVFLAEQLDRSIHSQSQINAILDEPVLVSVPYILTPADELRRKRRKWLLFIGMVLVLTIATVAVHFFYRPIDELATSVMHRFGLY